MNIQEIEAEIENSWLLNDKDWIKLVRQLVSRLHLSTTQKSLSLMWFDIPIEKLIEQAEWNDVDIIMSEYPSIEICEEMVNANLPIFEWEELLFDKVIWIYSRSKAVWIMPFYEMNRLQFEKEFTCPSVVEMIAFLNRRNVNFSYNPIEWLSAKFNNKVIQFWIFSPNNLAQILIFALKIENNIL
jgi:hypothetical protein